MRRPLATVVFLAMVAGVTVLPVPSAGAAEWQVDMQEHDYIPRELNITVGDTVTWRNVETHDDTHTVTSVEPGLFDSGPIEVGQTYSLTFDEPGDYPYFCEVHGRVMSGIVRVRAPGVPFAADDLLRVLRDPDHPSEPASGTVNVLANDEDPDGDPLSVTAFDATTPGGATVACTAAGECTYSDPEGPCPSEDAFSYTIGDGTGRSDTTTVQVAIECDTAPPADSETTAQLRLRRHLVAAGEIVSELHACTEFRQVRIQRRNAQRAWKTIVTVRSDHDGVYKARLRDRTGRYRAKALAAVLEGGETCLAGVSPVRRHRH